MSPPRHRLETSNDPQLLLRIRSGDAAAFEILFRTYFAASLRFAQSFVEDSDVAEDLVQEVFGWVWLHRAEWAPPPDLLSYLLTAVRNRALDFVRTARRRSDISVRYIGLGESPAMAAPERGADASMEADEQRTAVWRAIMGLPEQRRTVLVLRWRHGFDWDEVARIMGTTVAAARMNHSRALAELRRRLPGAIE